MTETQKGIEAKLLTEIMDASDPSKRRMLIQDYHEFKRACSIK